MVESLRGFSSEVTRFVSNSAIRAQLSPYYVVWPEKLEQTVDWVAKQEFLVWPEHGK